MSKIFIGFGPNGQKIYLTPEDRASHMHVIGSSGSGKSKFLEWMIRQDIKNGQGFCFIDPHGESYENIVKWAAYHSLTEREIILLNPSSGDYVIGFNPFRNTGGDISVQADYQITATIRAWGLDNTDETPTLERWLRCIFQTLIEKNQTLKASEYLIDYFEDEVREYLTSDLSKQLMRQEWRELASLKSPKYFQEQILSTKNKLFRFLCSDQIQRFMCLSEPILDIAEIMDEGKILLVNLASSENFSHYNARLFGALLVNEFFQQAKRRKRDSLGEPPRPFYLYLDEFQNFVTPDIGYILDQARKFSLYAILSHQRLGQLEDRDYDVIDAVLNNARIKAVFGGLRRNYAKLMVEEMFVNQLDLNEIKQALYQTKFWPTYSREKVYTKSSGTTAGISSSAGVSSSERTGEGEDRQFSTSALGITEAATESQSEGDIPIFTPMPFEELSAVQYWTVEEQIWRMSDALKAQFIRHCFIKILDQKTQPMLVPLVKNFYVTDKSLSHYQDLICQKNNAIPKIEADRLLEKQKDQLEFLAKTEAEIEEPETFRE